MQELLLEAGTAQHDVQGQIRFEMEEGEHPCSAHEAGDVANAKLEARLLHRNGEPLRLLRFEEDGNVHVCRQPGPAPGNHSLRTEQVPAIPEPLEDRGECTKKPSRRGLDGHVETTPAAP